jgi:Nucleotidyl transferase AbiEii toxin, Type IV TA system
MNLAEQIEQLVGRGFSEERAETIVLMREAVIIIFDAFPGTLVLVGGANLVLFQESVRHSADIDFFPVSGEMPNVAKLSEILLDGLTPLGKLLNLHPLNLKTISAGEGQIKLMLSNNDGKVLFTVDITGIGPVLEFGVEEIPLEAIGVNLGANIKYVSRNQLLLNKAEAFLLRRNLKTRDAYDAMDLLTKGASLTGTLKNHLQDMLSGEFDADRIQERIKQVDAKRCRAELKDKLPDEVYRNLEELDFQPLRDAVTKIFHEWL